MAISPVLLKGIAGVGAISTVAIGGIYLHNQIKTSKKFEAINNFALDENRTWKLEAENITSSANSPTDVSATLSTSDETNSWSCTLKGKVDSHKANYALDVESLKTALGITNGNKRSKNKNHNFKALFEKCKSKASKESTETTWKGVIDSISISEDSSNSKYKFDEVKLKELYDGTEEIIKELGISKNTLNTDHALNVEELKKIKFEGGNNVTNSDVATLKLRIEKTNDTSIFPEELKFIFKTETDITINNQITLKANTNPEFKVKITEEGVYSLEKAWDITKLAQKVNLTCSTNGTEKTCNLSGSNKINVFESTTSYVKNVAFSGENTNKIIFADNEPKHNQGFRFTVSQDITLNTSESGVVKGGTTLTKLAQTGKTYEIKLQTIGTDTNWFLSEVPSTPSQ